MERVYLTQKKYEELMKELERLKKFDRREIAKEIGVARDKGDISENAEYDAAKDKQGLIEKRIAELEDKLSRAATVESLKIDTTKINISAKVYLENLKTKEKMAYYLVGPDESDFSQNKISITSPVGKSLIGRKAGETVKIQVPAGLLEYKIVKFEYSAE
ncbi:MAG: transcription elongation factor GreA [Candidatus Omnitrophica bacterium]|nr:transcription elongation factor GreA [Candidatus Omnitrophota bacterium]MBU4487442.1 transcription elongation factor GreA [Candidatus Omnitrophota bacterium]MCG2705078.1 transcription elongation factor GreA [Candidatus Omnitrophota bacterium]